eukprot:651616-Prymnesium_polylepis.1
MKHDEKGNIGGDMFRQSVGRRGGVGGPRDTLKSVGSAGYSERSVERAEGSVLAPLAFFGRPVGACEKLRSVQTSLPRRSCCGFVVGNGVCALWAGPVRALLRLGL